MASKAFLEKAYLAYFGRPVDATGAVAFQNSTDADVYNAFYASPESQSLYGTAFGVNQINAIYNMLFGRDAEPAGLAYWANQVATGLLTPAGAALGILNGALNADATAVTNKLAASALFTTSLDTTAEILGYSGDGAAAAARTFLKGITTVAATQAEVDVAMVTTVAGGGATGKTSLLTAGADVVVGTAGNDTINALSIDAAGAAKTTFSAFDSIDGGAGNDTLNIYTTAADNSVFPTSGSVANVETVVINNAAAAAALADASKYVGVTNLTQVGSAAAVTNLGDATTAGFKDTGAAALSVTATNVATKATVALNNVDEAAALTITVPGVIAPNTGGALNNVTVSGTVKDVNLDGTVANITLGVTVGKDVQSLTLNTAVGTTLTVTNGAGTKTVGTVDASSSKGAITYAAAATVANVTGGSAADTLTLNTAYTATATAAALVGGAGNDTLNVNVTNAGANVAATTASVTGGAGNDKIALNIVNGATQSVGVTADAGDGDDTVTINYAVKSTDSIDAGVGTDTVSVVGKAVRIADDFIVFNKVLKNFETLTFSTAEGAAGTAFDASQLAANYTKLNFAAASFADNIGTQAIVANGNLTAEATGYLSAAENAGTIIKYAGALSITETVSGAVQAHADAVTLAITGGSANAVAANVTTFSGEAQSAVVSLTAGTDTKGTTATADDTLVASVLNVTNGAGAEAFKALTSLTVSGNGTANVINAAGTSLVTVNASGLNSVDVAGKAVAGLNYTTANTKAETITVGGGLDTVSITGSTYTTNYAKIDTISGLNLVLNAAKTAFDATKGDVLTITDDAVGAYKAFTTTQTDLDLALLDAAKSATGNNLVFQVNGNTYVYSDMGTADQVDVADVVVKLTGLVDLTVLAAAL
ncbi:MAG: DUF4214 domain-containing protein [Gallionella sp.]|nr:DUF4214 domain-containing protein [Gallionella sp.]